MSRRFCRFSHNALASADSLAARLLCAGRSLARPAATERSAQVSQAKVLSLARSLDATRSLARTIQLNLLRACGRIDAIDNGPQRSTRTAALQLTSFRLFPLRTSCAPDSSFLRASSRRRLTCCSLARRLLVRVVLSHSRRAAN